MDPTAPPSPSWSGLQADLLLTIANRLDCHLDRLRFRAVCTSWRSVLPPPKRRFLPPSPPLYLPFPLGPNPDMDPNRNGFFELTEHTVYCLQPLNKITDSWKTSKCWFIRIDEADEKVGKLRLRDPLCAISFPHLSRSGLLPKDLNLFDYRVSEVSKIFGIGLVDSELSSVVVPVEEIQSTYPTRLAVCFEADVFAVMAVHNGGQLSFWSKDRERWIRIDQREEGRYDDVVYRNGKFYACHSSGLTITIDLSLNVRQAAPAVPVSPYNGNGRGPLFKYLVNSLDDLILLDQIVGYVDNDSRFQNGYVPFDFRVYKLNEEIGEWVPVKSLGDRVIFIGLDCAFSVSAKEFPGCKRDCIYFSNPSLNMDIVHPGFNATLFDMEESCATTLSSVFSYSGLFWPPPSWIKTVDRPSGP